MTLLDSALKYAQPPAPPKVQAKPAAQPEVHRHDVRDAKTGQFVEAPR